MIDPQAATIRQVLASARRIAVVGLSPSPWRSSHEVARALQQQGYAIVPVNPFVGEVLGERAYPRLADVPGRIDLVDVFRREEHLVDLAQQVVARGDIGGLWFQQGLRSPQARAIADAAGIPVVEDRCLKLEVAKYTRELDLPPTASREGAP